MIGGEQTLKGTGYDRKLDRLGRITIPTKIRKTLGIHPGDVMTLWLDGEKLVITKQNVQAAYREAIQRLRLEFDSASNLPNRDELLDKINELAELLE